MIDFISITPAQGMTVKSYFKQHVITGALNKNALAMRLESSNADFCLTCLCIYDKDGGCICTKYTKNSSGDYARNQISESLRNDGGSNGSV
jgi:hypothetical protein